MEMLIDQYIVSTLEYKMIHKFYGNKCANRSKVPLINHINEGLLILEYMHAPHTTKRAYCLHPLLQSDNDLYNFYYDNCEEIDSGIMLLTMEYRNIANQYLSHRKIQNINEISLSPIPNVNIMLCADKIQNYKDFLLYHKNTHPRAKELDEYFNNWFKALKIENFDFWFELLQK